ncbi:unnamed protein product [Adineta ricciae]|uniref:Uncharacterized protein n=1 Tax=Adineta ricciae TaxID=249248 RepID=A0A814W0F5_ADIRI|nr:unnamed protein product [Adineta ricciae]
MLRMTNVDHKPIRLPPVYGFHSHPLLPLGQALEPILDISENFKDGEVITWWTVSSCSSSVDVKGKITVAYSSLADEKEIVLTLGTRLRVKSNALQHLLLNVVHLEEVTTNIEKESAVSRVVSNEDMLAKVMDDKRCSNIKLSDARTSLDTELRTYKVENYPNGDRYDITVQVPCKYKRRLLSYT